MALLLTAAGAASDAKTHLRPETDDFYKATKRRRFLMGAALPEELLESEYAKNCLINNFEIITPQNCMKIKTIYRENGLDFSQADKFIEFAKVNRLKVHGHALLWHKALPDGFISMISSDDGGKRLLEYCARVIEHFSGKVYSWDIVNEIISNKVDDGRNGLKDTEFSSRFGFDYIKDAFEIAAIKDPYSSRLLNDYFFNLSTDLCRVKIRNLLKFLDICAQKDVKLTGIGLQGHLYASELLNPSDRKLFFSEIFSRGLTISITELDVIDRIRRSSINARKVAIEDTVRDLLESLLDTGYPKSITTWGLFNNMHRRGISYGKNFGPQFPAPFSSPTEPNLYFNYLNKASIYF